MKFKSVYFHILEYKAYRKIQNTLPGQVVFLYFIQNTEKLLLLKRNYMLFLEK